MLFGKFSGGEALAARERPVVRRAKVFERGLQYGTGALLIRGQGAVGHLLMRIGSFGSGWLRELRLGRLHLSAPVGSSRRLGKRWLGKRARPYGGRLALGSPTAEEPARAAALPLAMGALGRSLGGALGCGRLPPSMVFDLRRGPVPRFEIGDYLVRWEVESTAMTAAQQRRIAHPASLHPTHPVSAIDI